MTGNILLRPASVDSPFPFINVRPSNSTRLTLTANDVGVLTHPKQPYRIVLIGPISLTWKIVYPITVTVEKDDDLFIASDDIFSIYGDGGTSVEAIKDYKISLIDYYQLVEARAESDRQTLQLFKHLQLYLRHETL